MDEQTLAATRRALHGVAELVIAGPQYRAQGSIELRVSLGGFRGEVSGVRVEGADLVWTGGRVALGGTCRELATALGVEPGAPGVYPDASGVDLDERLTFDPAAVGLLLDWFGRGDAALRVFAPDLEPILWPEHFDVGIALGEVNYGASPGDAFHPGPYAYVGPWVSREGPFWNAPFGAVRAALDLPDVSSVVEFFGAGRTTAG